MRIVTINASRHAGKFVVYSTIIRAHMWHPWLYSLGGSWCCHFHFSCSFSTRHGYLFSRVDTFHLNDANLEKGGKAGTETRDCALCALKASPYAGMRREIGWHQSNFGHPKIRILFSLTLLWSTKRNEHHGCLQGHKSPTVNHLLLQPITLLLKHMLLCPPWPPFIHNLRAQK